MNSQRTLRLALLLAGVGAVLLAPSAARAQQEVDPTTFDIAPLPAPAAVGQPAQAAVPLSVAAAHPVATADVKNTPQITTLDTFLALALLSCAAWIVLREVADATRRRSMQSAP